MKEEKKYKMLQIDEDTHKELKKYCKQNGMTMAGFIAVLVRQLSTKDKNEENDYNN